MKQIREALESALAAVWDGHYSGKGVSVEYARAVDAEVKAALAALPDEAPALSAETWALADEAVSVVIESQPMDAGTRVYRDALRAVLAAARIARPVVGQRCSARRPGAGSARAGRERRVRSCSWPVGGRSCGMCPNCLAVAGKHDAPVPTDDPPVHRGEDLSPEAVIPRVLEILAEEGPSDDEKFEIVRDLLQRAADALDLR